MAVIKAASSHASISSIIRYVTREEKTERRLVSGIHCTPETAAEEMQATKELYHKTDGRTYKHFVQSFAPGEEITVEQAHAIAKEFAEQCGLFQGFEVLYATHRDRDHVHTHFIVNSVSCENGYKFHMAASDLQAMKDLSDNICLTHGLSLTRKGYTFDGREREEMTAYSLAKYKLLEKAERGEVRSYVQETAIQVLRARDMATSREEFIRLMGEAGYQVSWSDERKYITFIDREGHRVRNSNLERTYHMDFSKEGIQHVFAENLRRALSQEHRQRQQHSHANAAAGRAADRIEHSYLIPKPAKTAIRTAKTMRRADREMQRHTEEEHRSRGRRR